MRRPTTRPSPKRRVPIPKIQPRSQTQSNLVKASQTIRPGWGQPVPTMKIRLPRPRNRPKNPPFLQFVKTVVRKVALTFAENAA